MKRWCYLAALYAVILLVVGDRWWSFGDGDVPTAVIPVTKVAAKTKAQSQAEEAEQDLAADVQRKTPEEWDAEEKQLLEDLPFLRRTPAVDEALRQLNREHAAKHLAAYPGGKIRPGTPREEKVHLFYTTDCTHHSLWQSIALEHTWHKVGSKGALSRLVSGCIGDDGSMSKKVDALKRTGIDHDRLFVFFGPRIDAHAVPGPHGSTESYPPINRPATVHYWFSHVHPPETVLGLLDPDMIFLKPLIYEGVSLGHPVGQHYDYLITEDWHKVFKDICTDCAPLTGKRDFCPGPPHMMHRTDWGNLMQWWLRYTVEARKIWGKWVAEMAGMSIGLAKLNLRSRLENDGMWDRSHQGIDNMGEVGLFSDSLVVQKPNRSDPLYPMPLSKLPAILHYCFTPELGRTTYPEGFWGPPNSQPQEKWEQKFSKPLLHYVHWSKYRVPGDWPNGSQTPRGGTILDCHQNLLFEYPPLTYMLKHYAFTKDDRGWLLFFLAIPTAVNEAVTAYKAKYCGGTFNTNKLVRSAHTGSWKTSFQISYDTEHERGFTFVDTSGNEIKKDWEVIEPEEKEFIRSFKKKH